jgi:hypothetical protein
MTSAARYYLVAYLVSALRALVTHLVVLLGEREARSRIGAACRATCLRLWPSALEQAFVGRLPLPRRPAAVISPTERLPPTVEPRPRGHFP